MRILGQITTTATDFAMEFRRQVLKDVTSHLVLLGTVVVTWIVTTEILFVVFSFTRISVDLSAWMIVDAVSWTTNQLFFQPPPGEIPFHPLQLWALCALALFSVAAIPLVRGIFRFFLFLVVKEGKVQPADKRHVAYAWSSGVIGLLCVLLEALTIFDCSTEDLLLGVGGLNMLVEEIRLLKRSTRE